VQLSEIPFGTTDWSASYPVAGNAEPHRSFTDVGARLFIVD